MKRATHLIVFASGVASDFNPRPREEGDLSLKIFTDFFDNFNPRPREEGDRSGAESTLTDLYFNPRPREEGDMPL